MEHVTVHGEDVPALGLGTWMLEGDACRRAVQQAIDLGYRHLDTAQVYGNEAEIGDVLKTTTVDRAELFLTTKVWNDQHAPDDVIASTEESLRKLSTDYVDLLLIHWPVHMGILGDTLDAMARLRDEGKVRHIGVSNFTPRQVEQAIEHVPIFCNQIEYHPFLAQPRQRELAVKHDFLLTAYSPLARGKVPDEPVLARIGKRHGKTPAQVALRWLLDQDNVCVVPKASSAEHLQANLSVFDFTLTDEEHQEIDGLDCSERIIDPPWGPDWER